MASTKSTSSNKILKKSLRKRLVHTKYSSSDPALRGSREVSLVLAILLIVFGASLIFWASLHSSTINYPKNNNKVDQTVMLGDQITAINVDPSRINIPKVQRELEISNGFIQNNRWTISSTGVSYLTTSGKLGQKGNVVLYGHNTKGVLGGLWKVQNGDIVEVFGDDGKVYKYQIFERKEVKPNALEILNQTEDSRLTIYTCSGFLDTARFVVVGRLVG